MLSKSEASRTHISLASPARGWRQPLGALLGSLLLAGHGPSGLAAAPVRMNVLFIAVDDLRPELACSGASPVKSPNIASLTPGRISWSAAPAGSLPWDK